VSNQRALAKLLNIQLTTMPSYDPKYTPVIGGSTYNKLKLFVDNNRVAIAEGMRKAYEEFLKQSSENITAEDE
jgi:hypothetical protein